ncbi:hypothetical protein ACFL05_00685 [Patescibacteria group bacterium]
MGIAHELGKSLGQLASLIWVIYSIILSTILGFLTSSLFVFFSALLFFNVGIILLAFLSTDDKELAWELIKEKYLGIKPSWEED